MKKRDQLRKQNINVDKEMEIDWKGFKGWHKKWNEEKGTVVIGLTSYTPSLTAYEVSGNSPIYKKCEKREISITLDARFPFSRKGKGYESWISGKGEKFHTLKIGWYSLIETIAHELAHAIINTIMVSYREDDKKGGHGNLHRQYNIEMKKMIEKDVEKYQELKNFWFKK